MSKTVLKRSAVVIGVAVVLAGACWCYVHYVLPIQWQRNNDGELRDIRKVQPESAAKFSAFIKNVEAETGWEVFITSGLRSPEEQAVLKKQNANNASAYRSKHVQGLAIDVNLFQRHWFGYQRLTKSSARKRWELTGIVGIADRHGLKWGGNFKSYYDPVHFEITR